ncbi:peptidylprolyl isomerase [Campylobacter sp. TTU_617]|uniref:peptidylprolyl isomerase n=1 Tax=Campylobacter sp. TTU_617 TaxID=2768148 RepID=UPI0019075DFC|nr:peptidylprolyl isomerase [Campylobacter sp. TTU_617]MBK1971064.1 SurA N-terminal domain-containing protein [Campylobacter sp. TTU_617]
MLTWMQHHKKYLVVTIWISVIAFVGAGFVGWGAYDFNLNRNSSIAVVGDEKITFSEFNTRYNQIYNYYNQISNNTLNEQKAKELQIDLIVLNSLIEDKLLLSFAKDIGLNVSNNEIIQELIKTRFFQDNQGDFNKTFYYNILKQNNLTPKEYEQSIYNELLIDKLNGIFNLSNQTEELKMLSSSFFMQDLLNIEVINYDKNKIDIDEKEVEKLWQETKENYKTEKIYEISLYYIKPDTKQYSDEELYYFYNDKNNKFKYKDVNGRLLDFNSSKEKVIKDYRLNELKEIANKKFLDLKSGKISFQKDINITKDDVKYPIERLTKTTKNEILRPFEFEEGFMIIRLNKVDPIRLKTFEEAKNDVLEQYLNQESRKKIEEIAQSKIGNFKGINIGFVSRDSSRDSQKLGENILNDTEFNYFLMNVFNSDQNSSYVILNDTKAVVYKINKQELFNEAKFKEYKNVLEQNLKTLKSSELKKELVEQLKKEYPIKIYYKGN